MAAIEGGTKAIASLFRDDSEGINFDWHNGWKRWTLGKQKRWSGGE